MSIFKIISKNEFLKTNKKPNQLNVWNKIAKPWQIYRVKKIPIIEEFLKNKKGKVIDFGCGGGRNMIPNSNITYYGIDFSDDQLKNAEKFCRLNKNKAKFFKSKINNLDKIFKNNFFDYGIFIGSLHCLETKKARLNALKEFFRVLKHNSEALISVWNSEDKRFAHVNNNGDIYMSWKEQGICYMRYYYLYKKQEFLSSIKSVGFKLINFYEPREHDRFSKKNWIVKIEK